MMFSNDAGTIRILRVAALIVLVLGAAGSTYFMLRVGHRNKSYLLLTVFAIWVLSPFVALWRADIASRAWSFATRTTLYCVMLIVGLSSLVIYGAVALGPPRPKPAAFFLIVPLASWLLMPIVIPLVASMSATRASRHVSG